MREALDESLFDRIADDELRSLERALDQLDPDECEIENAAGVLTLSFADGAKVVVNSHRAARQVWMAAYLPGARNAWHFSPARATDGGDGWSWRTPSPPAGGADELRAALADIIKGQLGRAVSW